MVTREEALSVREKANELYRAIGHVDEVKNRMGDDPNVRHPVTGKMVGAGKVTQADVNSKERDAQDVADELSGLLSSIGLSDIE